MTQLTKEERMQKELDWNLWLVEHLGDNSISEVVLRGTVVGLHRVLSDPKVRVLKDWRTALHYNNLDCVRAAEVYMRDFNHGTPGHNLLELIAGLAKDIDDKAK